MNARPFLLLVPLVIFVVLAATYQRDPGSAPPAGAERAAAARDARLVVVIVDSLRKQTLEKPGVMPNLLALARDELRLHWTYFAQLDPAIVSETLRRLRLRAIAI